MPSKADLQRLSQLRLRLVRLRGESGKLVQVFLAREPFARGTVYELRRKCGRPSCRCAQGELHATTVLSWKEGGRTRLRVLSETESVRLRTLTQRYRRFRKARARLVKFQREILAVIDQIEGALRKEV